MISTAGWQKASYCKQDCCLEATWHKSSFSFSNGNCVEAADLRKSSRSTYNGNCVEAGGEIKVRDSQLGDTSPILGFTPGQWNQFLTGLK